MPAPLKPQEKIRRRLIGDRVRRARELNRMTLDNLSFHLAQVSTEGFLMSRQTLQKIEAGMHPMSPVLVNALALALKVEAEDLTTSSGGLAPGARVSDLVYNGDASMAARKAAEQVILAAAHERFNEASAAWVWRNFNRPLNFKALRPSPEELERQAEGVRMKWGLGETPVANLTFTLEQQSVTVVQRIRSGSPVVFAAMVSSRPVLLWHGQPPSTRDEVSDYRLQILETFFRMLGVRVGLKEIDAKSRAAAIARAVLLPKVAVTGALGGTTRHLITTENIICLASNYAVPLSATLKRAVESGIMDQHSAENLRRSLNGRKLNDHTERPSWKNLLPLAHHRRSHLGTET